MIVEWDYRTLLRRCRLNEINGSMNSIEQGLYFFEYLSISLHGRLVTQLHKGLLILAPGFPYFYPELKKYLHPKNLFHV